MPILKNMRHEHFAQELAKGKTATEAYEIAGYKRNDSNSSRLSGDERIKARVAELAERGAARAVETIASMAAQFDEDRAFARGVDQAGAAHSASVSKAKLFGLMGERVDVSGKIEHDSVNDTEAVRRLAYVLAQSEGRPDKLDS